MLKTLAIRIDALILVTQLTRLTKRCVLNKRVLAQMPGPLNVVIRPMGEVAYSAAKFAEAVAKEKEEFESHYRDNRKRLIACAWELAYLAEDGDERVAYEFACACLRANRTKTAHRILEELAFNESGTSKHVVASRRRLARLAWKAGDVDTAVKAFRSVRGRAARAQYRTWLGVASVRNGLLLAESGDKESGQAVLMGGLVASGLDLSTAQGIAAIYMNAACKKPIDRHYLENLLGAPPQPSLEHGPVPIILSGFGWSGSGAVADFLKGSSLVNDVFSGREVGLWTGKYGLDRLYAHFISRGFNRRLLLEFLTRHCFGHIFLGNGKGTKSLGGIWARLPEPKRGMFLQALAQWLESVHRWQTAPDESLLDAFQVLSSSLLQLLSDNNGTCVLLSNCIPSDGIIGIRMFRAPVVIVSWRDPADAYLSKKAAFPDNTLEFAGWQNQLLTRIAKYLAGKTKVAGYARFWMDLSFEDFVQDDNLRQRLLNLLNLDDHPLQSTFDPTVSARNIGIHTVAGRDKVAWEDLAGKVNNAKNEAIAISGSAASDLKAMPSAGFSRRSKPESSL